MSCRYLLCHCHQCETGASHRLRCIDKNPHFQNSVRCFAVLWQIHSIHHSVSQQVLQTLVASLVLTPLDYTNATLANSASNQLDRLQSGESCCVARIFNTKSDHITPLLCDLHWLRVPQQLELLFPRHGTVCRRLSGARRYCHDFVKNSRRFCSSQASADSTTSIKSLAYWTKSASAGTFSLTVYGATAALWSITIISSFLARDVVV